MTLAMVLIPCLNAVAKYLSPTYSTIEITWARYAGHFIFMVIFFIPHRGRLLFQTVHLPAQILRSTLLLASTGFFFSALRFTSMPIATAINFVAPFFVIALARAMLDEPAGWRRWIAALVGLSGALLILRPGSGEVPLAAFLVFGSSICSALYQVLSRSLAAHDPAETSITYIALVGFVLMSVLAPFDWKTPERWSDGLLLVKFGLFGGFGHYYIVKAFQWGPASVVAPLTYGQLLGAAVLSAVVFGEIPGLLSWIGAAIIVGSGLYILYIEGKSTLHQV